MLEEITAAVTSLKTAFDITKGAIELSSASDMKAALVGIQDQIIHAQQSAMQAQASEAALINRVSDLEKELARIEAWEAEKRRYQLERLPPGILVYGVKPGAENGEPPHKICANCYNKGVKSLLHITGEGNGMTSWKCHACGFDEMSGRFVNPPGIDDYDPLR